MNSIFNSTFEISLRILLTLYVMETDMTLDRIVASDFITIYSADFGLSLSNLHGINEFNFSEYAIRREQANSAIRDLLLNEEVILHNSPNGFTYSITKKGTYICDEMTTKYAAEYINATYKTKAFLTNKDTVKIINDINNKALLSTERK